MVGQENPLDGRKAIAVEGSGVFSYFIKIVPTRFYEGAEYTSNVVHAAQVRVVAPPPLHHHAHTHPIPAPWVPVVMISEQYIG